MQPRKIILLILALAIAAGTMMMARSMMQNPAADGSPAQPVEAAATQVLVASRDLPSGTIVKDGDVKWQPWPTDGATEDFTVKGKGEISEYNGAVVRRGMNAGEPITATRVIKSKEQGFMAAVLNPGMRAVSISMTPVGGVAGFVFPGDRVDVIVTHQVNRKTNPDTESSGHKVAETILTNVRVLALDQKTDDQAKEPKVAQTATLEVTPRQAETVALSSEIGTLSLSLRSLTNEPEAAATSAEKDKNALAGTEGINVDGQSVGAEASIPPLEERGGVTWDSDVSRVLSGPASRSGAVQHIQVMRGKETSESVFEVRQDDAIAGDVERSSR